MKLGPGAPPKLALMLLAVLRCSGTNCRPDMRVDAPPAAEVGHERTEGSVTVGWLGKSLRARPASWEALHNRQNHTTHTNKHKATRNAKEATFVSFLQAMQMRTLGA